MSKILKDSTYNELKSKADAFDLIMSKVDASDDGVSIEEQANLIIQVMEETPEVLETETQTELINILQSKIDEFDEKVNALNATINERDERISELEAELDSIPGATPAAITIKEESTAKPDTLVDFANRNAGNTEAILSKLKEEGLL